MEKMIAECAERIAALITEKREVNILHLCELLSERSVIAYQALGWLAREGRVSYVFRDNQVLVAPGGKQKSNPPPPAASPCLP